MHALIPLLFIFIAFNSKQLKEDMWYRANVFFLVGTSYFFMFQYTLYWYRVFLTDRWVQFVPGLIIVLLTVAIALSAWNRKSHPAKTIALGFLCFIAITTTLSFDHVVKEKLAQWGGYFDSEDLFSNAMSTAATGPASISDIKEIPMIGIRLKVSPNWQQHRLASGYLYFTVNGNDKKTLEVRPNCLGDFTIDTPTFVANTFSLFKADASGAKKGVECRVTAESKQCLITVSYSANSEVTEKWRWLYIDRSEGRGFLIDALFYEDIATLKEDVRNILLSTRLLPQAPTQECFTPASWL
jgi:hypothetical protein